MKKLITTVAIALVAAVAGAATYSLVNGLNQVNAGGRIVAIEGATVGASQAVALKSVYTVTEYTNAYLTVTTPHTRYDFSVTNFDGNASISTNQLDRFSYDDWRTNVTVIVGSVTNTVYTRIVGGVTASRTNIVTRGTAYQVPKATFAVTNDIVSATASAHFLTAKPASDKYFTGSGKLLLSAGDGDNLSVVIEQ